jgi:hypothetical protein
MKSIDKSARIALQAVDDLLEAQGVPVAELTPLPSDPYEFLTCCCYTYDELAKTIGLDPKRAFPDKEYLRIIVQQWLANPMFHIEKSRQIMVTWIFAALWLWWVLKHPGQRVAWICKTFNDASDHIEKRIAKMYEQIPASYQKPAAKFVDGEFRVYHNPDSQIPTSTIEAIAAEKGKKSDAASQLRSFTFSGINWEEAPFQPGQAEVYGAGMPCIGIGGRFNISGSANGRELVWRLAHGRMDDDGTDLLGCDDQIETLELMHGVTMWDWNGFRHLRVHYSADPDKDPETEKGKEWYKESRSRMKITRKWLREMEISFDTPAGTPVFCDTERIIAETQCYDAQWKVYRGWDFGFGTPVCLLIQVWPILDGQGNLLRKEVHCLKEFTGHNIDIANFYEGTVKPWIEKYLPRGRVEDFGDPAGNQKESTSGKSDIEVLASLGVLVRSSAARVETTKLDDAIGRVNILQAIISAGDLQVDPVACAGLLSDLRGGYHRSETGQIVKTGADDCSHRPDSLGYLIFNLFSIDQRALHGQDRVHHSFKPCNPQPSIGGRHDANSPPGSPLTWPGDPYKYNPVKKPGQYADRVHRKERWDPHKPSRPGTRSRNW